MYYKLRDQNMRILQKAFGNRITSTILLDLVRLLSGKIKCEPRSRRPFLGKASVLINRVQNKAALRFFFLPDVTLFFYLQCLAQ